MEEYDNLVFFCPFLPIWLDISVIFVFWFACILQASISCSKMHFNNRGIVAAWHLQPTSDTEHRWCFKCPKEEGHAKEKNNNSRCWLICVSVAHWHPAPTYIKQAAGRWWHHSAALIWQIVACYRRTVLPLGYNSVLNVFSCQWFAVQCVKEKINYVASLIYFDFLFCSLLQIWQQPLEYKSVLPFCFVFQILLSYSNLQKHPRIFAGHLFAKRVRWPWTHTDRVVIELTTL